MLLEASFSVALASWLVLGGSLLVTALWLWHLYS
jgi:hypothetical protein